MKYAIVRINGHQYKVEEGQEFLVDKLTDPKKIEAEVLLVADGETAKIGTPTVDGAKVTFKVLKDLEKGEKIDVLKYKSKSRSRKKIGFRHQFSKLQVTKIS